MARAKTDTPKLDKARLLALLAEHPGATKRDLAKLTGLKGSDRIVLKRLLRELEAEGAIAKWRDAMGATDPKKAAAGTIRHDLGTSIGNNVTHGSDAPDTAAFEIGYFFAGHELI